MILAWHTLQVDSAKGCIHATTRTSLKNTRMAGLDVGLRSGGAGASALLGRDAEGCVAVPRLGTFLSPPFVLGKFRNRITWCEHIYM